MKKTIAIIGLLILTGCASTAQTKPFGYEKSPCACVGEEYTNHAQG